MSNTVVQLPNAATAAAQSPTSVVTHIRFLADAAPEAKVLRVFREPRPFFAVEEAAGQSDLARRQLRQETTDQLIVVLIPGTAAAEAKKFSERMSETADLSDASSTISIVVSGRGIKWRPGLALIEGRQRHGEKDNFEGVLAAVTDFSFY